MTHKDVIDLFRVPAGRKVRLRDHDPGWKQSEEFEHLGKDALKERAKQILDRNLHDLAKAQGLLYADDRYAVLIVLQALDAAGKDGTIKHVMSGVNPQGCQVFSFKKPSAEELQHDFLWRYARCLPERGHIGIFNRSYYEDVLVVKVHPELLDAQRLPPGKRGKKFWKHRYDDINAFEQHLVRNGTVVLKFFLNVSKGAEAAVPGAPGAPREELEILAGGPGRAGVLGRLPAGLRGRPERHQYGVGAVVHRAGRQQVGDAGRGRRHHHHGRPGPGPELPGSHRRAAQAAGRRPAETVRRVIPNPAEPARAGTGPGGGGCRRTWCGTGSRVAPRSGSRPSTSGRWCARAWPTGCSTPCRS